ncbi:hypothetical protein [Demequina sp. SO4-18]|uniref:hypothetical protein n=1 Tax=Demequina sp. SO4-18 TaxID=3401026 RepID=UPI003B5984FF
MRRPSHVAGLSKRMDRYERRIPRWEWAVVDSVSPTKVVMDSGSVAMRVADDSLVPSITIGDRVEVRIIGDRRDITGRAGG